MSNKCLYIQNIYGMYKNFCMNRNPKYIEYAYKPHNGNSTSRWFTVAVEQTKIHHAFYNFEGDFLMLQHLLWLLSPHKFMADVCHNFSPPPPSSKVVDNTSLLGSNSWYCMIQKELIGSCRNKIFQMRHVFPHILPHDSILVHPFFIICILLQLKLLFKQKVMYRSAYPLDKTHLWRWW